MILQKWRDDDLPQLAEEGLQAGINWTGPRLTGWDFTVPEVLNRLDQVLGTGLFVEDETSGHHRAMADRKSAIVLVDDLRSFVDGRPAKVARTSSAGVELLDRHRSYRLDELWLDHDLGDDDTRTTTRPSATPRWPSAGCSPP
nr:cyclic-phosphate processing receiver domain-containing protein [Couchioplanes caeruleus]